jgi:Lon-like ATP-dependent protease
VPAGQGREIIAKSRIQSMSLFKNQNLLILVLVILSMFAPWWAKNYYTGIEGATAANIIFAAMFMGGMVFLAAFVLFINLGAKMKMQKEAPPKIIVDNFNKKQVPFLDATGAHAGALLGDVLHDPFQCFKNSNLYIKKDISQSFSLQPMQKTLDNLFQKHKANIIKNKKNYEAIFLNKNELFILGESNNSIAPVEVLSCNRQDYDGKMIKITTSTDKELIVTPEHKIAINNNGKIVFKEAKDIKAEDEIITKSEDIIIDEQNIINTYDERQQEQCRLYYQYLDIKSKNPFWGYKRIAKAMNQPVGKTRWWHANKHIPVPIQTANWLKDNGLLPLKSDHKLLPTISKILGALYGDGGIFENLNGIFLSSSELESVKEFGDDIYKIFGPQPSVNFRIIEGGEKGHSWCYQNTNRAIIRFFISLGAPKGNKTRLAIEIPQWIYFNDKYTDEFFGSFLGGELGSPKLHKQKNRLQTLDVAITGPERLEENRINFLNKIKLYLESKSVESTSLIKRDTTNKNLSLYRLLISVKFDNVANFIKNIKINYCKYKQYKLIRAINELSTLKKKKYEELISRGYGAEKSMRLLQLTPHSLYQVLNGEKIES